MQEEKEKLFRKWHWNNLLSICGEIKLDFYLIPYTKVNFRWVKNINVKGKTKNLMLKPVRIAS